MNNNDNEPAIAAFIVIPTRLNAGFFNALCAQPNNAMPLAQTTPASSKPVQHEPALQSQSHQVDSQGIPAASGDLISEKQFGRIKVIEKKENITDADVCKELGIISIDAMTKRQASEFISRHEHA